MTEDRMRRKQKNDGGWNAAGNNQEHVWIQEFRKIHNGKAIAAETSIRLALA